MNTKGRADPPNRPERFQRRDSLEACASAFCIREKLLDGMNRVAVGLSGGADSVALCHYLKFVRGLSVSACHLNHLLRGEESFRDEAFVRDLCIRWEIPLRVRRAEIRLIAERKGVSCEEAGRNERYRFFGEVLRELEGDGIATAHTASDQLETLLFNLTRGAAGLVGIPPSRCLRLGDGGGALIVRPLLECSREQVEDYCARHGLSYVTDSTNMEETYTRNKLRRRVVPVLAEINPAVVGAASRAAAVSRQEEELLDRLAAELLARCKAPEPGKPGEKGAYPTSALALEPFSGCEPVLLRRALALCLRERDISVSHELLEETAAHIRRKTSWSRMVPGGGRLVIRGGRQPCLLLWAPDKRTSTPDGSPTDKTGLSEQNSHGTAACQKKQDTQGNDASSGNQIPSRNPDLPAKTYFPWEEAPVFAFEWEPGTLSEACLPDGSTVRLEICGREAPGLAESGRELADSKQKGYKNLLYLTLDYDKIEGNILIRQRLPGDRISLAGGNGTKKLKKLFNEKKLTAYEKSLLPVLADREGVVGILGVGADRRCLPGPGTTRLLVVRMEKPE